jgi:hypothetical protein
MFRLPARVMVLALLLHAGFPAGSVAGEEAAAPASPSPPLAVTVDHGLVSVDVRDALLADVLGAVAEQVGIQVSIHNVGTERVTQSFAGVGLDEAIRRLASGYDVVLIYRSPKSGGGTGRLAEVRVYEASAPAAPPVVDPGQRNARLQTMRNLIGQAGQQQPGALASLAGMLGSDPDPVVRRSVAVAFGRFRGAEAVAALTSALDDQDPSVRTVAVSSLGRMRDETVAPAVAQVLARDPDAGVRRAAVWALAALSSEDAHRGLEAARSDADTSVRQAALAALARWERRARANPN